MADKAKGADLSGLDNFNVSSFLSSSKNTEPKEQPGTDEGMSAGAISYAPIGNFHEDEDNARQEFDPIRLQELVESMTQVNPKTGKVRGVLEPLSVKRHPDKQGHFIINGGARRFRAAKIAELEEIPFIVKDELDDFDKFVLNDQREQLSPMEIAIFIEARLKEGNKPGQIAKALGRRPAYVSDHSIFFDMAPCIRDLYDNGYCRSMQVLAWLHRGFKKYPSEVESFCLEVDKELTSSQVRSFLDNLKKSEIEPGGDAPGANEPGGDAPGANEPGGDAPGAGEPGDDAPGANEPGGDAPGANEPGGDAPGAGEPGGDAPGANEPGGEHGGTDTEGRIKKAIIQVKYDEREARLLTEYRAAYGLAWIKYEDDGQEIEVDINQVSLVAIIEA